MSPVWQYHSDLSDQSALEIRARIRVFCWRHCQVQLLQLPNGSSTGMASVEIVIYRRYILYNSNKWASVAGRCAKIAYDDEAKLMYANSWWNAHRAIWPRFTGRCAVGPYATVQRPSHFNTASHSHHMHNTPHTWSWMRCRLHFTVVALALTIAESKRHSVLWYICSFYSFTVLRFSPHKLEYCLSTFYLLSLSLWLENRTGPWLIYIESLRLKTHSAYFLSSYFVANTRMKNQWPNDRNLETAWSAHIVSAIKAVHPFVSLKYF